MNDQDENAPEAASRLAERSAAAQRAYSETMALGFEQARLEFENAQQAYARDLQSLYAELNERSRQAWQTYGQAMSAAYTAAPGYEEAAKQYRAYLEALQRLLSGGDAQQRQQQAYERYLTELADSTQRGSGADEVVERYRKELESIWNQQPLRQETEEAYGRYVESLQRLASEARERESSSWRELVDQLVAIWSPTEVQGRSRAALEKLLDSAREALVSCHATVEKSSSKAIETLSGDKS